MGLVCWIAIYIKNLEDLFAYVDDAFSWDFDGNLEFYEPYETFMPDKQCSLLLLWDELGIPHEESKQVSGNSLCIIGFEVNITEMTISMPPKALADLLEAVTGFAKRNSRRSLRDFQKMAGWLNWALNVFPLLRPGLSTLYDKMRGKTETRLPLCISVRLCRELIWLTDHIHRLPGVNLLLSREWSPSEAEVVLYSDACPTGIRFWHPNTNEGFQYAVTGERKDIFFLEALGIVSALHWFLHQDSSRAKQIVIFTDNENSVNIFNSLHASPSLNPILITSVDLLLSFNIELRVVHIAGHSNSTADALSRFNNKLAHELAPGITILPFIPPQLSMGASSL